MSDTSDGSLAYKVYRGAEIAPVIGDLAALRIAVFREWPYLYDGDAAYESAYLQSYTADGTILVAAYAGDRMVGASTGMPLSHHADDFAQAFAGRDPALERVFYCAESVLLPACRGRGAYRRFFAEREAEARAQGFAFAAFCAVVRPEDHPARPADARPLDPVWRSYGYAPHRDAVARFSWTDLGASAPSEKPLQFWIKRL